VVCVAVIGALDGMRSEVTPAAARYILSIELVRIAVSTHCIPGGASSPPLLNDTHAFTRPLIGLADCTRVGRAAARRISRLSSRRHAAHRIDRVTIDRR
jgi:hypothetical protein